MLQIVAILIFFGCKPLPQENSKALFQPKSENLKIEIEISDFLRTIFSENEGLFLGDIHGNNEIPNFIIDSLGLFEEEGLKVFFIEMIKSKDQEMLDRFLKSKEDEELRGLLEAGWNKGPGWIDLIIKLILELDKRNIKVIGIDTIHTGHTRLETSNPHWVNIVNENKHLGKYLIWGGLGHSANYPSNKGVDYLLKIPSIDFGELEESVLDFSGDEVRTIKKKYTEGVYLGDGKESNFILRIPKRN